MEKGVHLPQQAASPMVDGLDRENPGSGSADTRMGGTVGRDLPWDESGVAAGVAVLRLFCHTNIDELPWPTTTDADFTRRLMVPMMKEGIGRYVSNIDDHAGDNQLVTREVT